MMTSFHHFIPEVFSCFFRFPIFTETTFKCSASTYPSSVDINNTWEWCWVCLLSWAELISAMRQIESLLFFHFHVSSIFTSYSWWFQIVKFKISFWLISVVIMKLISNFIRGCCCRCKNGCCRRERKESEENTIHLLHTENQSQIKNFTYHSELIICEVK